MAGLVVEALEVSAAFRGVGGEEGMLVRWGAVVAESLLGHAEMERCVN